MSTTTQISAEQLLRMPECRFGYELIEGELRKMTAANREHCLVAGQVHMLLGSCVRQRKLGATLIAEPGFLLARDPDTVRVPDVAFIARERLRATKDEDKEGFCTGAPDLAVEVVSPGDRRTEVREKAMVWLDAGAKMVWVVDPERRTVTVYSSQGAIRTLTEEDELDGEEVVPGFRCRVSEFFVDL